MTEEQMAQTPTEGEVTFTAEEENDDSQDSPTETNEGEETQTSEGEQDENSQTDTDGDGEETTPDKDTPFHEHPRWKQREDDWNKKFNDQETRHQDDLKEIREEFGKARKDNAGDTEIPSWFGGDQAAWNAYRKDQDQKITEAEQRIEKKFSDKKAGEDRAVEDATQYIKGEISSIESDQTLNPDGKKIDPNKLLKIVMDNDLVDSKGRWNYKAGWRLMQGTVKKPVDSKKNRKNLASATTSESRGETKPKAFKTSEDFKQNRPW